MISPIDHYKMKNYVEFSFCLPINDLFYEKWDDIQPKPDGREIKQINSILNTNIDIAYIEQNYWDETNNVEVYHSVDDREVFIYFDLIRDIYDQCDMIYLGIRCNIEKEIEIRDILLSLYKKRNPRSNFNIDYFNQSFYHKVFNSDFYFYKTEINKDRKMLHHGL